MSASLTKKGCLFGRKGMKYNNNNKRKVKEK